MLPTKKTPRRVCMCNRGGILISIFMRWKIQKIFLSKHNAWPYLEIDHVEGSEMKKKNYEKYFFYSHRAIIHHYHTVMRSHTITRTSFPLPSQFAFLCTYIIHTYMSFLVCCCLYLSLGKLHNIPCKNYNNKFHKFNL